MFFNRVRNVVRQGFELGRSAVSKAPSFIGKVVEISNKANNTAKQIADKASQVQKVYETSKKFVPISGKVDSAVNKGFNIVSEGVKRIDDANRAVSGVGGAVGTLF